MTTQTKKLKGTIQAFIIISVVALAWIGATKAQPVPAMPAPKPVVTKPALKPVVMKPAPRPAARRVAVKPVVMKVVPQPGVKPAVKPTAPVVVPMAVVPVTTAPAAPAPVMAIASVPPVTPAPAPKNDPVWKSPGFWIGVVGGPALGIILSILFAFGVIKPAWLQWLKEKKAVEIADKVITQFETYAKGTQANWDDILAQVLKAVVARVGVLTDSQEAQVKAVVAERKEQAAAKQPTEPEADKVSEEPVKDEVESDKDEPKEDDGE